MSPMVERASYCALIVFAALLLVVVIPAAVADHGFSSMSPRFFPQVAAIAILVLSALALAASFTRPYASDDRPSSALESGEAAEDEEAAGGGWLSSVGVALSLAGFALLFEHLGYPFAAVALLGALAWLFGERRPARIAALSCGVAALLWAAFEFGLGLPLS